MDIPQGLHADLSLFRAPVQLTNESVKSSMVELKQEEPCTCNPCECTDDDLKTAPVLTKVCPVCSKEPCLCGSTIITKEQEGEGEGEGEDHLCPCGDDCECDIPISCECNPCECDVPECEEEEEEEQPVPNNITIPIPIDYMKIFIDKLNQNFRHLKRECCYDAFGKRTRYELSRDLLHELLVEDHRGKLACYLPGNILYPKLLKRRINDEDTHHIHHVLMKNRSISSINLAYNRIKDDGLIRLSSAIKVCGNISHVNLMHNNFTGKGLTSLVHALIKRAPLQTLRLTGVKFGNSGIDALACLILSGRSPLNLDIGECDLSVKGFQTFCTALHALDNDINYPYFLIEKKLPFGLERLKEMKEEYNTELSHLAHMGEKVIVNVNPLVTGKKKQTQRLSQGQDKQVIIDEESEYEIPNVFQEFSSTVLQGLFDIRNKLSSSTLKPCYKNANNNEQQGESTELLPELKYSEELVKKSIEIGNELKELGSMGDFINEYKNQKVKKVDENIDFYSIPIVSPSYYKLDVDEEDVLDSEFVHEIDNPERYKKPDESKSKIRMYHGQVIDFNESILRKSVDESEVCDEFTANDAARLAAQSIIKDAGTIVGEADEITQKSDVIQLLLMTLCDYVRHKTQTQNNDEDANVEDCTELMESAIENLEKFIIPPISEKCITLQLSDIKAFSRALVEKASQTFLGLINNTQVCKILAQDGTIACRENEFRECHDGNEKNKVVTTKSSSNSINNITSLTEEEIRHVAIQFLNNAIDEAARLIGTGDPFGFRDKHTELAEMKHEEALVHAQQIFDTEANIFTTVEKLIELGGQIAESVREDAQDVQKAENLYKTAAENFIESLFEDVRETLGEYLQTFEKPISREETDLEALMKLEYRYVSRPTRLVLNRPFFPHYEELMGAKLGDYLKGNRVLKALHIQKWGLKEDGMIALMDGLMMNKTIKILDLGCNELAADGMKPLGMYLATNKNLKHLVLNHNHLKDPGVINLIARITESNIVSLNIAHNDITWVGLDPLLTLIPQTKISALYLWGNAFGLETWKLFKDLLDQNIIQYSDTLVQQVDEETFCIVKDSQVRETNEYYEVAPVNEGLHIPPYMTDPVYARNYEED